jgi:nucleoside-diphosphate-sugar epimerase
MRVLVTGGTGFVGTHTVAALLEAGHDVKLLVRSPEHVRASLEPLGVQQDLEVVAGDVTEPDTVERAIEGCDAALHGASVFTLDASKGDLMRRVNVAGTEHVLSAAVRHGLDPIVHVSSELSMLPPDDGAALVPSSPVRPPPERYVYCHTKGLSELVARRFQAQGAPVVSVMPPSLWGPHDPHLGEGPLFARSVLRRLIPAVTSGGLVIADVRDVARALAATIEPGRGPRSYLLGGHYLSVRDTLRTLGRLTGRRFPAMLVPKGFMLGVGSAADVVQRHTEARMPWSRESIWIVNCGARCDDARARAELGFEPRPIEQTFADTVRWLVAAGHVTALQAGRLAPS